MFWRTGKCYSTTSAGDEFGIRGTRHPACKSNNNPTQPLSLFYPMLSHYSPFHPSLSPDLFCRSVHLAHPPLFLPSLFSIISQNTKTPQQTPATVTFVFTPPHPSSLEEKLLSRYCSPPTTTTTSPHLTSAVALPPLHPKWSSRRYASPCFALINSDTRAMNNETDIDDSKEGRVSVSHCSHGEKKLRITQSFER